MTDWQDSQTKDWSVEWQHCEIHWFETTPFFLSKPYLDDPTYKVQTMCIVMEPIQVIKQERSQSATNGANKKAKRNKLELFHID